MDPDFSHIHQMIYRKYSLFALGAILILLIISFCYDAYSAYRLTYLRGSR